MEVVKKSVLITTRLKRAALAVKTLSDELDELRQRLSLVEIHNEELQDFINRIGESAAQIASSIDKSMEGLGTEEFIFNEDESNEIASAEEFSASGSVDDDFDF